VKNCAKFKDSEIFRTFSRSHSRRSHALSRHQSGTVSVNQSISLDISLDTGRYQSVQGGGGTRGAVILFRCHTASDNTFTATYHIPR